MSDSDQLRRLQSALADRYLIVRELGRGGMATVYLARDRKHERAVALKVLRPELGATLAGERFLQEIRISAALDHPHILTLIDSGNTAGFLWYVVPHARGESLRQRLNREKQLAIEDAVAIARQVASALSYAHAKGVIHRDVKPENILMFEGQAMLADFGIALAVTEAGRTRLTESGISVGTPEYMSPEQASGSRNVDARSDVYALGAVLYEMLVGEPPHTGANAQAVIAKVLSATPTSIRTLRETVPPRLDAAVMRALAKIPVDRFDTVAGFVNALTSGAVPPEAPRSWRWARAGTPYILSATVAALVAVFAWVAYRGGRAAPVPVHRQVTFTGKATSPALSPDGQFLAYVNSGTLVLHDLGSDATVEIGTGDSLRTDQWDEPTWSRDGTHLWFWASRLGSEQAASYRVPRLGGRPRRLAGSPGEEGPVRWWVMLPGSPPYSDSLVRVGVIPWPDTLLRDTLTLPAGFWQVFMPFSVSADGHWIVLSAVRRDSVGVVLLSRDGRRAELVAMEGALPTWSRSDDVVDYVVHGRGVMTVRIDRSSGRVIEGPRLLLSETQLQRFSVSEDRTRMAYAATRTGMHLWTMRLGDAAPDSPQIVSQLTTGTASYHSPSLAPGGERVAFIRSAAGTDNVFVMPSVGGMQPQQLTFFDNAHLIGAEWSPEGERLASFAESPDGGWVLKIVELSTGRVRTVPRPSQAPRGWRYGGAQVRWAPDGAALLYPHERQEIGDGSLFAWDLSSGHEVDLLDPTHGRGWATLGAVSPDGKRVAIRWEDRQDPQTWVGHLWILTLANRTVEQLLPGFDGIPLLWSKDDLIYFRRGDQEIWVVSPKEPSSRRLYARLPLTCDHISMSADARVIVCDSGTEESDIWIVHDFDATRRAGSTER